MLDADQRGCSSCHDLKDVLTADLDHWLYYGQYENEKISSADCAPCHTTFAVSIQDRMHRHMDAKAFTDMGGSCNSCHYFDEAGQTLMWDEVKYDVMHGMTDVAAADMDVDITWNQDEITPPEHMFYEAKAEHDWNWNFVEPSDDVLETYAVNFTAGVAKTGEMTIQDMIDKYGTETRTICNMCTIVGEGGSYIYQAEVTGVPLNAIMADLGVQDENGVFRAIGLDGYEMPMYYNEVPDKDPLIAFEMNGEPLPAAQGYPVALWMDGGMTGGVFTRFLSEISITPLDAEGNEYAQAPSDYAGFIDPETGAYYNMPNIGVLTEETGTIFPAGSPVHLEGYAFAFYQPVTKLEFSFDHGATWIEVPTEKTENAKWVYWKMDINNLVEPGSYLMKMRATSLAADGTENVSATYPNFLINIQ